MNRDEIIIHILEQKYNILWDSVEATMRNVSIADPRGASMLVGEINQRVFEAEVRLAQQHLWDGIISGFECVEDEIDEGLQRSIRERQGNINKRHNKRATGRLNRKLRGYRSGMNRHRRHRRYVLTQIGGKTR
jgi:hypothetical protein